jgi:hypothetical protein
LSSNDSSAAPILTAEERERIAETLAERGARGACPACHENDWLIGDGYSLLVMRADLRDWTTQGPTLPLISRICRHCGHVSLHAAIALGLHPPGIAG